MIARLEIFINEKGPYRGTLRVETDRIDVTMAGNSYKPDPEWTHVDKAGHFHAFAGDRSLPTLERYEKHLNCDGSCGGVCEGEGWTETRYRCRACGKRVKPGYVVDVPGGTPRTIPGRTSWGVTVETVEPPPTGTVSVRCGSAGLAGRDWFGLAEGRVSQITSSSSGQTYTYDLSGVTELGRRP